MFEPPSAIEKSRQRHDLRLITGDLSMLLALSLCAMVCAFFIARFFAAKTRFVNKDIDAAIARRLSSSSMSVELSRLREQNGVMRNLLIDMLENEGSVAPSGKTTLEEQERSMKARIQRRREIFGETVFVLQQEGNGRRTTDNLKING